MKPEELARKNCDTTINLNSCCDMLHCMGRVQIVLIVEREEWQLCTACYEKYLTAIDHPRTRDAVEHCVEPSQDGLTVKVTVLTGRDKSAACLHKNHTYLGKDVFWCYDCGKSYAALPD